MFNKVIKLRKIKALGVYWFIFNITGNNLLQANGEDKRSRRVILTTCCSTSEQTTLLPPTCTSMGLLRILRANASIALGKVAENMTV